jgi:hypothetical protein
MSLPSVPFAFAAMLIAVVAVVLALVTPFGGFVKPLSISAAVLGLATLAVAVAARAPLSWPAVGATLPLAILVLVLFFPNTLGQKYVFNRHPELDPDFTFVTPRRGFRLPDVSAPKDPNGVDASKFGLDRDWFHIQINSVSAGSTEVRALSASGQWRTEPHLTIAVSYGNVRESKTGTYPAEDQYGKLTVILCDARGNRYERQDLALASQWDKAKSLGSYVGGTIRETMVFAVPPALDDGLRLEITVPNLGTKPLTFTIPKSPVLK